jgi:predicted esterase
MIVRGKGEKAILMLHGRGGDAEDIIGICEHFDATCYAFTANGNAWYPNSFLEPRMNNEPFLSMSLKKVHEVMTEIKKKHDEVFILGFSQGACLALDYGCVHEVSGVIAFSGGFIGSDNELPNTTNKNTKRVFIACSSSDPFIPLERAKRSADIFAKNGAVVVTNFYRGNSHTITKEDIERSKKILE